MLDMGFAEDLEAILTATPRTRQTALFSATISAPIARSPKRHLQRPGRASGPGETRRRGRGGRASGRSRTSCAARTSSPRWAGSSTSRTRRRRSSSRRTRGEVDDLAEALAAAATTPRPSTAAWPRSSATGS